MQHPNPLKFLAKVVDGRLTLDQPVDAFTFPEGAAVTLGLISVVTDQCRYVFFPGILNPPGNRKPRVRTRCTAQAGHEGPHSFEPQVDQSIGPEPLTQDEDADEN